MPRNDSASPGRYRRISGSTPFPRCRTRRRCAGLLRRWPLPRWHARWPRVGTTEIGDARLKPVMASSISAASSAVRASAPVNLTGIPRQWHRMIWREARVGRDATMPQNEAGIPDRAAEIPCPAPAAPSGRPLRLPIHPTNPRGSMPIPGIAGNPEHVVEGVGAGGEFRRVVLPSTMAPAAFRRRTASASSVGTLSLNNGDP